jgi:hypothetical protein
MLVAVAADGSSTGRKGRVGKATQRKGGAYDRWTMRCAPVQTATVFMAVLLVFSVTRDGNSHWLAGLFLLLAYAVVAGGFWVHCDLDDAGACLSTSIAAPAAPLNGSALA